MRSKLIKYGVHRFRVADTFTHRRPTLSFVPIAARNCFTFFLFLQIHLFAYFFSVFAANATGNGAIFNHVYFPAALGGISLCEPVAPLTFDLLLIVLKLLAKAWIVLASHLTARWCPILVSQVATATSVKSTAGGAGLGGWLVGELSTSPTGTGQDTILG